MRRLPPGVVFDCDGTLADTEALSDKAWIGALAEHGYEPTDADFQELVGYPFPENWAYFSRRVDLGDQERFRLGLRDRFVALFEAELELHEDAVDTLRELAAHGVPIGVASSSTRSSVNRVLDRAGVRELVRVVVGVDDVEEHKPAPEPYLRAAAGLELEPWRCSAVEDTPVGVRSARAAGLFTVAVVRAHGDPDRLAGAHRVVDVVTLDALLADDELHASPALDTTSGGEDP
jgi:HAD superfamily hydrolase (TIGR01509 family)